MKKKKQWQNDNISLLLCSSYFSHALCFVLIYTMPGKFLIIILPSTKEVTTCKHEIINGLVSNFFNSTACLVFVHSYLPSVYVCPD